MLQLNRVPETRRLGSTEAVNLNHLAGIRTFIEGYGSNRMDQRGDARACLVPLAGLDAQAVAQELSRGLIHTGVAAMGSLANWIDAKPYRFTLILLAHTAVVGAILAATARF